MLYDTTSGTNKGAFCDVLLDDEAKRYYLYISGTNKGAFCF